jgi:UrcA family protein
MARKTIALFTAGLAGLMLASSSFAGGGAATPGDAPSVRVSFADLDLGKDAGVERLYTRLRRAAGSVCGAADIHDMRRAARQHACVARALGDAVDGVHNSKLTARHRGAGDTAQLAASID